MRTQIGFHRFVRTLALVSLLAFSAGGAFAEDASSVGRKNEATLKAASSSAAYDLEIKGGELLWKGKKRDDNAKSLPATLDNVIDQLREQHPNINFVISPGLGDMGIADLKLRSSAIEQQIEAVRVASGTGFAWRSSGYNPNDPEASCLFVLTENSERSKINLRVEAFNLSGYFDTLVASDDKKRGEVIQQQMHEIEKMVYETVDEYRKISDELNTPGMTTSGHISIKFHQGANLVIVIGEPEAVTVAAKVIGALPRAQRSIASSLSELDAATRGSMDLFNQLAAPKPRPVPSSLHP